MLSNRALESVKLSGFLVCSWTVNKLIFSDHVSYAPRRDLGKLQGLYRIRTVLPENATLNLVQGLVLLCIIVILRM